MMESNRIRLTAELKQEWLNLGNKHGKMFVPPRQIGLSPISLMIVGESPAETEVEQGKPFVGYSGQIVTNKLEHFKFRKHNWSVYITNAVKIAHFDSDGSNINPTDEEIDEWRRLIIKEIVAYNPAAVLMLGGSALYSVISSKQSIASLDTWIGIKEFKWNDTTSRPMLFLTYHPSALWREKAYKARYCDSWEIVVNFLRESAAE